MFARVAKTRVDIASCQQTPLDDREGEEGSNPIACSRFHAAFHRRVDALDGASANIRGYMRVAY